MSNTEDQMNADFLTKERQFELFENIRARDCEASKLELLNTHKKLLVSCVRTYFKKTPKNEDDRATREEVLADLQSQAKLYFLKAIEKFDHTRDADVMFGAYAKQWIIGGLSKQLLENWTIVSMSARAFRNLNQANLDAMERLREQGCDVTELDANNTGHLSASHSSLLNILRSSYDDINAEIWSDSGSFSYGDTLADENVDTETDVIANDMLEKARQFIASNRVTDMEREIYQLRMDEPQPTFEEIGRSVGLSGERCRQIFKTLEKKLHKALS